MMLSRHGGARLLLLLACALAPRAARADANAACFRCHGTATLSKRTPGGEVKSLAVDPEKFAQSEHGHLSCVVCHGTSYQTVPHPPPARAIQCLSCHGKNQGAGAGANFADIEAEFARSMHSVRHPEGFSCASCHDTHRFRRWSDASRQSISEQNGVCLDCHTSQARFARITAERELPDLPEAHRWLPHRALHWQHVRCLDCHSSYGDGGAADEPAPGAPSGVAASSHRILPAKEAVRDCVACHSANSVLKLKLYRHARKAETEELGFMNAVITNNAYVIGATRNRYLDAAGVLLFVLTVLGAAAHGLLRVLIGRRGVEGATHE